MFKSYLSIISGGTPSGSYGPPSQSSSPGGFGKIFSRLKKSHFFTIIIVISSNYCETYKFEKKKKNNRMHRRIDEFL